MIDINYYIDLYNKFALLISIYYALIIFILLNTAIIAVYHVFKLINGGNSNGRCSRKNYRDSWTQ